MKRMTLIAAALCLIMLATVGAGVVAANAAPAASQNVKQFAVTYEGKPVGKIVINTNNYQYTLAARGLIAGKEYWLACEGRSGAITTATANAHGDLHAQGC